MITCSNGCGGLVHIRCTTVQLISDAYICADCSSNPPALSSTLVLKRVIDLTNLVLEQRSELAALREEAKNRSSTAPPVHPDVGSPATTVDQQGRSAPVSRARASRHREPPLIGTSTSDNLVPAVTRSIKRIFVSKISPEVTAKQVHEKLRPHLDCSLSVRKLRSAHESYASFCLYVETPSAEAILLSPDSWNSGTVIKPYRGFLPNERIIESYEEPSLPSLCGLTPLSTRPPTFNFSSPITLKQGEPRGKTKV